MFFGQVWGIGAKILGTPKIRLILTPVLKFSSFSRFTSLVLYFKPFVHQLLFIFWHVPSHFCFSCRFVLNFFDIVALQMLPACPAKTTHSSTTFPPSWQFCETAMWRGQKSSKTSSAPFMTLSATSCFTPTRGCA